MPKDYYKSLNVEKGASKDEIKKAFRKLAHEHHPDKTGGNDAKFKEINEAYSVLSDDTKRQQYDQFGSAGPGGFGGGQGQSGAGGFGGQGFGGFDFSGFSGGFGQGGGVEFDIGDIFGGIFGGSGGHGGRGGGRGGQHQARGADIQVDIEITFRESIFGADKQFSIHRTATCDHCKGSRGEPGSSMETCKTCNGQGQVIETRRSILGAFQQARTCDNCFGTGKIPKEKCKECKGKGVINKKDTITVVVPAGIQAGESLRVNGKGEAVTGGVSGDLYIRIHVRRNSSDKAENSLQRDGYNLVTEKEIKLSDALLGGEMNLETLDGALTVSIPQGITHGEILRVRGKGVPMGQSTNGTFAKRGDLLIKISLAIPKKLSKEAKKLAEELKKEGN